MSRDIPISLIDADPEQPRKHFDQAAISELAQSMAANGLAVPILVRPVGDRFTIVHGERRWRAATSLDWETIPADVRTLAPEEARWISLVENIQRVDLSPIEEARAYQERLATGLTQEQLGQRLGKTQSHVATKLRYLKLPVELQDALHAGILSEGHAKQLLRIDDADLQQRLYQMTRDRDLTVKALHAEVSAAARYLEAQRTAEEAEIASTETMTDDDLLAGCRCEMSWDACWPAEDFALCGDRLTGVFARLMYAVGQRDSLSIYADNMSGAMAVSFEAARHNMRRRLAQDMRSADLIFVHVPPRCETIPDLVRKVRQGTRPEAVVLFRTGAEHPELASPTASIDFAHLGKALVNAGYYIGPRITCSVSELFSSDPDGTYPPVALSALHKEALRTRKLIDVIETWMPASMSRDMLPEPPHWPTTDEYATA